MKKNQKYTREEMFLAIELWKESGLSQMKYCHQNGIAYTTFKHWVKKMNREKKTAISSQTNTFLPVQVKTTIEDHHAEPSNKVITITYPNGIEVKCPVDISTIQLKTLLTI